MVIRQFELVERVLAYDPQANEDLLNKAYVYTVKAHGSQLRASGDPYFSHPVEVAGILTGYKLDWQTIIVALLHDTVEDTVATLEDVENNFGKDVMRLVDGVTKLSQLELKSEENKQAENFRKLFVAMSDDIRVLLVKLADRLHNMRTLHYIKKPEKRRRIALETMEIYAPLAERIGMQEMKEELEDISFRELNTEGRDSIMTRLEFLREESEDFVERIRQHVETTLSTEGVEVIVTGREKRPYSIWRKMQKKNVSFEQLTDIVAFRAIVGDLTDCYRALGVIHSAYRMVPDRFKDYISVAKPNGYRSLHTTVIGPEGRRVEIQIRSKEMHEQAERGVAAHWSYKQGTDIRQIGDDYRWLRELREILDHASSPEEFLEHTKLEMFQDQVFCFTPKGDLIGLPSRATPIDFAYAVHSRVGDTCAGAKVNGRMVPLRAQLKNGDQVEILRKKDQLPSPMWENFVVTGKARSAIRKYVRNQQREQYSSLGEEILLRAARALHKDLKSKDIEPVLNILKKPSVEEVFSAVGEGRVTAAHVLEIVFPNEKPQEPEEKKILNLSEKRSARSGRNEAFAVPIRGLIPGMAVHFARCCHPLPGDRIVGLVTTGKGVTIHTLDCDMLEAYEDSPERWIDVGWDKDEAGESKFAGRLTSIIFNQSGALSDLTTIISQQKANISNLKITNRTEDFFEILLDIEVRDVKHLNDVIAALRTSSSINSVERAKG